jgi:hypothetical protein
MSAPTCLSCNKPFPANGELASLPEGRRIAFDPGRRRVWRICTTCGEWNLLGTEAAGVTLKELEARQPALGEGVHTSHLSGRMELVRVNNLDAAEVAQFARAERHRVLAKAAATRFTVMISLVLPVLGTIAAVNWWMGGGIIETIQHVLRLAAIMGYTALWRSIDRWWQGVPPNRWLWLGGVAGPAVQIALDLSRSVASLPTQIGIHLIVTLCFYLVARNERWTGDRVSQGPREWDQIKLRWRAYPLTIQLRPLRDEWLSTEDSEGMLRTILTARIGMRITPAMVEEAVRFITHSGPLGLLGVLEGLKEREGGELTLGAVPPTYLIALDIALAGAGEASDAAFLEHERLREATAIAQIAESLDEEKA